MLDDDETDLLLSFRLDLRRQIARAPLIGRCLRFRGLPTPDDPEIENKHYGQQCFVVGLSVHQIDPDDPVYIVEFEDAWLCDVSGSLLDPLVADVL